MLSGLLIAIDILVCIALIGVVLMQRSEGGAFGMGGGPTGLVTARGAGDLLTRTTWILFVIFLALSIGLSVLGAHDHNSSSILQKLKQQQANPNALNQPTTPPPTPLATPAAPTPTPGAPAPTAPSGPFNSRLLGGPPPASFSAPAPAPAPTAAPAPAPAAPHHASHPAAAAAPAAPSMTAPAPQPAPTEAPAPVAPTNAP